MPSSSDIKHTRLILKLKMLERMLQKGGPNFRPVASVLLPLLAVLALGLERLRKSRPVQRAGAKLGRVFPCP